MSLTTMWLILCGLCLVIEIFTVSFLVFFPGIGAFLAFIASLLGANITIQCILFVVSSFPIPPGFCGVLPLPVPSGFCNVSPSSEPELSMTTST